MKRMPGTVWVGLVVAAAAAVGLAAGVAGRRESHRPQPTPTTSAAIAGLLAETPNPTVAASLDGAELYAAYCASCHGPDGEGEPNWKVRRDDGSLPAPPHDSTGHTWHHSDQDLLAIIAAGGGGYLPESNMPGFADVMSPEQMRAVLAHIKTMWGPEERAYQADITAQQRELEPAIGPTDLDLMIEE